MQIALFQAHPAVAQSESFAAVFTPDAKLKVPKGFRRWVVVGAPLTPNGLNGGEAGISRIPQRVHPGAER
jgi:hypothetical protein